MSETCCASKASTTIPTPVHPLDPLTQDELAQAAAILKQTQQLGDSCRFPYLQLEEPPKAEVLAFEAGKAFSRRVFATVLDKSNGA
ncbi:hypothetical protein, partial [Gilvimarinus sp. 1_MG-2023]